MYSQLPAHTTHLLPVAFPNKQSHDQNQEAIRAEQTIRGSTASILRFLFLTVNTKIKIFMVLFLFLSEIFTKSRDGIFLAAEASMAAPFGTLQKKNSSVGVLERSLCL